ncbi:carboxypeptidase-like regulatory domain-containing protein [Tautonia rosea]|uniref:carboxypeptidase-like regulatory domain-containing protein n=1 Tax=Tautonia rosea TaxID=2728037 RepID=UPI0014738C09|nr:carboxypeptidase-like regulatory domain-containing protein [Tautonia rosea]
MSGHLGLFLLVAALFGGGDGDEEVSAGGTISGRVVDHLGGPVGGARVWAIREREGVGEATADEEGRFRLGPIEEGRAIEVWAEGPGLAREHREGVLVFVGADRELDPLPLLPGTTMTGRAVDAEGRPIAGATIDLELYRFMLGHTVSSHQTVWTLVSDDDGRFVTPPLPAGQAQFALTAPGKARTFCGEWSQPGTPEADLGDVAMADEVPIRGVVVDHEGEPAPDVRIMVDYDYENPAFSGEDGRFVVHGVGENAKELRLDANDFFAPEPITLGPAREDLRIVVTRAFLIEGNVVDAESGEPVEISTATLCTVERHPDGTYSLYG